MNNYELLLDIGLQPVSNRFRESNSEGISNFPLSLSISKQSGLIRLDNPFPVKEVQPRFDWITCYEPEDHLDRLVKNHPYLSDIAQYPKEMQVFLMDNTFNMGPKWLSKFKKTEVHLKNWVTKGRKSSDLEKMKAEYKNSDHYRGTTRAQDLVAMLTIN